jgi:hypothetical protein
MLHVLARMSCWQLFLAVVLLGGCVSGPAQKGLLISDTARLDTGGAPGCEPVVLELPVTAVTISGTPVGLRDDDRGLTGTARLGWQPCLDDVDSSPGYGRFVHDGAGAFSLELGRVLVEGSGALVVETEVWGTSHHVRFVDGERVGSQGDTPPPVMQVDGISDATLSLWSSFSVDNQLESDLCPQSLSLSPDSPHTFSLDDGDSTLLLQLGHE